MTETTKVLGTQNPHPSRLARLRAHWFPKPLRVTRHPGYTRLIVQTETGGIDYVRIYSPLVYFKGSSLWAKCRWLGQLVYKFLVGAVFNQIGYGFFAFVHYFLWQNPFIAEAYDNPMLVWYGLLHFFDVQTGPVPQVAAWYLDFKHFVLRDAMEVAFRGAFFWIGFTNALSPKRQVGKHSIWARTFAKTKVIPTEVQSGWTKWWQLPFVPAAMYLVAIPIMSVVFIVILVFTRDDPVQREAALRDYAKWAGLLGAYLGTRYVVDKIAVDFHHLIVDAYNDRGIRPRWPWPASLRALHASRPKRSVPGNQAWLFICLIVIVVFLFGGWYVGMWILNNVPWLADHTLFSKEGWDRLIHGEGITKWWL
jgi:hypothetical protein